MRTHLQLQGWTRNAVVAQQRGLAKRTCSLETACAAALAVGCMPAWLSVEREGSSLERVCCVKALAEGIEERGAVGAGAETATGAAPCC